MIGNIEPFLFYEGMNPEEFTPLTGVNINKLAKFLYNELTLAIDRINLLEARVNEDVKVGDLFLTTVNFSNALLVKLHKGYGTWAKFGNGHALVAIADSRLDVPSFMKTINATGGEYTHKLTIPELPSHNHIAKHGGDANNVVGINDGYSLSGTTNGNGGVAAANSISNVGEGVSHNNIQPSITVGAWLRLPDDGVYNLSADKSTVNEGDTITFTLQTMGIPAGTAIDWVISGISSSDLSSGTTNGQFIIDATGQATYSVVIEEDLKTEGTEVLNLSLLYIENVSTSVIIVDTSKYPEGELIFYEGSHTVEIPPNQVVRFHVHASGGGGGGSVYSGGSNPDGTDGRSSIVQLLGTTLLANGGKKGTGGVWGNGSSFHNGQPGLGGIATASPDSATLYSDLELTNGIDAITYSRWGTQLGAEALPSIIGQLPGGGNGAWGVGDEAWSFGGAAGSGSRVRATYTNITNEVVIATLIVESSGKGWKSGGNPGTDGGTGFIVLEKYNLIEDDPMILKVDPNTTEVSLGLMLGTHKVNWGDGNIQYNLSGEVNHTYAVEGNYTILVEKHSIDSGSGGSNTMSVNYMIGIKEVVQWWSGGYEVLKFAKNEVGSPPIDQTTLVKVPIQAPKVYQLELPNGTPSPIFYHCTVIDDDNINSWDVSNWYNFSHFFEGCLLFNRAVGNMWEFTLANNFNSFLKGCSSYTQPWHIFDSSNVVDPINGLDMMFYGCNMQNRILKAGWCVPNLTEAPPNFSTNSGMIESNLPIWGSCPIHQIVNFSTYYEESSPWNNPLYPGGMTISHLGKGESYAGGGVKDLGYTKLNMYNYSLIGTVFTQEGSSIEYGAGLLSQTHQSVLSNTYDHLMIEVRDKTYQPIVTLKLVVLSNGFFGIEGTTDPLILADIKKYVDHCEAHTPDTINTTYRFYT